MHLFVGPVGDDVGLVLQFLELDKAGGEGIVVVEHIEKELGPFVDLVGQFFEEVVKLFFPRNESHRRFLPVVPVIDCRI